MQLKGVDTVGSEAHSSIPAADAGRKEAERRFHNERFGFEEDPRAGLNRWYAAVSRGERAQVERIKRAARGATVLEYGCGRGKFSLINQGIAECAGAFHGIDISDVAIRQARDTAALLGFQNCTFDVMDGEAMTFPSEAFDLVFGRGIIHHLTTARCFAEVARVLKSGGSASFFEPMGHNPLINGFRKSTPDVRTADEHPLLMSDIQLAKQYFSRVEFEFFGLTTLFAVPFLKLRAGRALLNACDHMDRVLLNLPGLRRNAWFVLLTLTK